MTSIREIDNAARKLVELLSRSRRKLVLAESCTGGLVSATLTKIPGVSQYFCGSAVTYQLETKTEWLDIPEKVVQRDDAVTREVAVMMATQVLERTPQADIAASVTGHLGPEAPQRLDGVVFVAIAERAKKGEPSVRCRKYHFPEKKIASRQPSANRTAGRKLRLKRQRLAVLQVISDVAEALGRKQ
ncbi:MAG: CinA family protein [Planctomycetaceae bacterium]